MSIRVSDGAPAAAAAAASAMVQLPLLLLALPIAAAVQPSCPDFQVTDGASCNNATQLPGNPHANSTTVAGCCQACAAHAGCETFVWEDPENTKPGQGNCRLAAHCPGIHEGRPKTVGVKAGPSPPPAPPPPAGHCALSVHPNNSCPNATDMPSGRVVVTAPTVAACCAACVAHGPECGTFVFEDPEELLLSSGGAAGNCLLKGSCPGLKPTLKTTGTRPVPPPPPPLPPLPPPPLPPSVKPGSQKNVIVLLTDDQDLRLGSMRAMPYTMEHIGNAGANISNFFVHTPICCPRYAPAQLLLLGQNWTRYVRLCSGLIYELLSLSFSRTTLLSGRFYHNNKVSRDAKFDKEAPYRGCMSMNTSLQYNPGFWDNSLVATLKKSGYVSWPRMPLSPRSAHRWCSFILLDLSMLRSRRRRLGCSARS